METCGNLFKIVNQKQKKREERQQLEKEGDYFKITKVVCSILEISPLVKIDENLKKIHEEYFLLMKKNDFLKTEYESSNQVKYDPAKEVKRYFQENPETNRVALGCCKAVNFNNRSAVNLKSGWIGIKQ